ncbi:sigma-54-dependent transcriptional regulator [Nannocystis bainbridge]|uniref:Sigma-54 dependent transcriptional regulator n=1 Tax=Nannocystis bainbridge TaxID=2995303 RepID=A0ABT5E1H1_9BACT|nr:sigma-54 dependent transcriptional regulator [Nannocystis bainbridge]MDC0719278.1 sigma-54 dependent transcriptional regulator [Nannocystis bainbridge]
MTNFEEPKPTRILVVDDESSARSALSELLREEGYEVQSAADGYKALGRVDQWEPDVVITDVKMPGLTGLELITKLREIYPDVAVVVMTAFGSVEGAVEALHLGADDYLGKPVDLPQLLIGLQRVLRHRALQREARQLRSALASQRADMRAGVIGQSKVFRDLLGLARQVADSPVSVLVTGERGTGKQHLARLIHQWSGRRGPFVSLQCSGFTDEACARELFGVREGGAVLREGRLVEADGGTLFLADVDELPAGVQAALLRFLQDRTFCRVGDSEPLQADVRVIAATSQELGAARGSKLREDLYYRLNVVSLRMASLRERRDDVPLLAMYFLRQFAAQAHRPVIGFSERALGVLLGCDWSGNIRQLENSVERAVVLARGAEIEPRDLPRELMSKMRGDDAAPVIPGASLREIERYAILRTLEHVGGSTSKAAKILGISPRKIQYRLNEYRGAPQTGMPPALPEPHAHRSAVK